MLDPPLLPQMVYTPFYCEENIYILCEALLSHKEVVSAVFISNESKTIALNNQKLGGQSVVLWDYHAVLWLRSRDQQNWIYDFDSSLPFPCLMKDYLAHTFEENLPLPYISLFRIVPGSTFVEYFASDRSHMLADPKQAGSHTVNMYRSSPPPTPPIRGKSANVSSNLMESFVCMGTTEGTFGTVNDLRKMKEMAEL
ncbi:N-terminal glutamine amidase-domain-containing protein [Mycena vitilis]|nr:N-terminal glutamine amidase-domain-containing protein [Mycena vitilis]